MKKTTKFSIGATITFVLLFTAAVIISYYVMKSYVPGYEGEIQIQGLNNDVNIYTDNYGVPHIIAQSEADAAFALGYLHARERLFQMDMARRAGEGKLSEIIGSKTVPFDKMFRTLGLYKNVKNNFARLNPESKKLLNAYCKGVNYFIDNTDRYSIEFDVLGYSPKHWKPEESLLLGKLMAFQLNLSWWSDITYSHLLQKFDEEKVKEIIPDYPENAPTIIPNELKYLPALSLDLIKTDREFRNFMGFTGTHIGSNNWVVNGSKSVSGKPMIANDPHLAFQAPGTWFFADIKSDNWNVTGFTIPGLPAVVIGTNRNIAWALTNVMADDADFYVEKFDSTGTKYLVNDEWRALKIVKDTIHVKDSSDVQFEIKSTYRGPIVSDIHPYNVLYPNEQQGKANLSMRWTAYEPSDELDGMLSINKAGNWNEFLDGVKDFTVPGQNFAYADSAGNIGYICAARLPIRPSLSPTMIYDGTTDQNDWLGFVPFEKLPRLFNPPDNFIASANNKTISDYPYHISNIWEPSSRIERINAFLKSKKQLSQRDYKKLQNDFYSYYAREITPYILNAFGKSDIKDENLETALDLLDKWDFVMKKQSQTPAIYNVFLVQLLRNIFVDEMGEELFNEYVFLANIPYRVIEEMLLNGNSSWFDDVSTNKVEDRDEIIRKSLVDALDYLEAQFGDDPALWQWGSLHKVEFKHLFAGQSDILDRFINIGPYEIGGDGTTVFNTEYSFSDPYENNLGPSMRYIYDFAKPDEFIFIMPTGQSGHILSEHYDDMTKMWLNGTYIKLNLNEETIESTSKHRLLLQAVK